MSIRMTAAIWDLDQADVPQKLVLLALADWADDDGRCCFTAKGLAAKIRLGTRKAQSILRELEREGVLRPIPHAPGWRQININLLAKRSVR